MADFAAFRRSIAARLILLVTVVAVPLIGLQFYFVFEEAAAARHEALDRSNQAAQAILGRIENQVRHVDALLSTVAATVPLQHVSIEQGNTALRKIKAGLPDYIGTISLLEPNGTMLYSAESMPPTLGSINVADRRYFREALNSDRLVVGDPIISRTSGKWIVVFARAIRDEEGGKLRGVVSMSILLERFQEAFTDAALPHGSLITVINREGVVIARSIDPRKWVGMNLVPTQTVQDALHGRDGAAESVTADGIKRLSAIAASREEPWVVLVGIPAETALFASRQHLQWAILLTVLVAGLAIGTAIHIARGIAVPLRELAGDAAMLARGTLEHRTTVDATGEVGELAASFNAMAQELDVSNHTLRAALRLMAGQNRVLEMIARDTALSDTLDALLHLIEDQYPAMLCSILLLDAEGKHLHHGAAPSLPREYMHSIDGGAIGAQAGSCGTAAFRHQAVFVEDIENDPLWVDYRDIALRYGLRACWSTPIYDAAGTVLGTFAIYYREPGLPNKRHLELIEVATHTAAIAICRERAEAERRRLLSENEAARRDAVSARDLLASVFARMNDGIVALDRNWRYAYLNQHAARMLNRSKPEDLLGKHIWTEYPEGPEQPFGKAYRQAMDTQQVIYLEDYYAPWGRWFENRIYPSPDGLTIYFTEITERKKALEDLRASENKFAIAFRSSPDAITLTSAVDGNIVDINEAGVRLTGYSRDELVGRSTMTLNLWVNASDRERYLAKLTAEGRVLDMQTEFRKKSGEVRIGLVSGELIDLGGRPHILGVIRDITAQKRAEAEIRLLNAELEQRVVERTAQLEAANKELEAFSYSVSHDLKAPLRGIDGYSQLLEENYAETLDEDARLFIHNIRQGTAQMHDLIEDLLVYARMERRSPGNASLNLRACVEETVQGYAHEIAERGAVLQTDVPSLNVQADREGIGIVLRNLLDNALKFTRNAHPPRIAVGARAEGDKIVLWVRDNGVGFDMKFRERIFEIFSRLQRTEEYSGTGLGLALVRKAALRMGGRVWAESAPGKGATFYLELRQVPS
jgi:PAS domain S-box-containing protein